MLFTTNPKLPDFWPWGIIRCFAVLPDTLAPLRKQIAKSREESQFAEELDSSGIPASLFVLNCRDIESIRTKLVYFDKWPPLKIESGMKIIFAVLLLHIFKKRFFTFRGSYAGGKWHVTYQNVA